MFLTVSHLERMICIMVVIVAAPFTTVVLGGPIDPNFQQQAYIKASNTNPSDLFGEWVAIYGDTLVVGAVYENSNTTGINGDQANNSANDAGAAYVYTRNGTEWSQQAYIKASNTDAGDRFGQSIAISGDTLVIGAEFEDSNTAGVNGNQASNSAADAGAVYVFVRSGSVWSQQAYIKASNAGAGDEFGRSVAISGDTLGVGAFDEDSSTTGINGDQGNNSSPGAGAVYVFTRSGTVWSQQAYLKASNTDETDRFGRIVAISGDTLVVGATGEDSSATGINGDQNSNSASHSGAAYVFTREGTAWQQQAYIKASNTDGGNLIDDDGDFFGGSVALSGDTLVVGAEGESSKDRKSVV